MGAINRSEKEALDKVCEIASPQGSLKRVIDAINDAVGNVTVILQSNDVELPDEMVENMKAGLRDMESFKTSYQGKASEFSASNRRLSEDFARRMAGSQKSATDTKGQMAAGTAAANEIKGGVK